ncbi:MAG: hypothetical protein OIF32_11940 [Campylobacterales bacterium]|nr:hypothetical protein [Campylobacterales bacterium]
MKWEEYYQKFIVLSSSQAPFHVKDKAIKELQKTYFKSVNRKFQTKKYQVS